ncbi:membrane protein [Ornatilinea apprima]|uniref:Membrane protein n=1 Tax=Ornatilinea apprima TaxID=1134406 RepID=A0A0P6XRB3_9CHLR|nr:hypothetical protein [Ornatilinea apprima]KPL77806.1 membrane protein [Ornatilinea apprima]
MESQNVYRSKTILKFAGAFIAWVIGSGFATGQEVLQFFTSYGYLSYGVVLLNLIGFIFLGQVLLITGYEHKAEKSFNQFKFFCGEKVGTFYSWLIPITLVLVMPVLISGAGATLSEYYGINHYIGSALMAGMVLCAYLIGFERLIKIVSTIGPVIILFSLMVGTVSVIRDFDHFVTVSNSEGLLRESQSSPHWALSSILYLSLNFLSGSTYFTELGKSSGHRNDAKYGALLGATALVLSIAIMNTAILLNAENTAVLAIPVLFLAKEISYSIGAVFSIVLILGMFSSCSAMMWSVCNRFTWGGKQGNRLFAIFVAIFIFVLGLFSFSDLLGVFYPLVGYMGLLYIGCVIYKGIKHQFETRR